MENIFKLEVQHFKQGGNNSISIGKINLPAIKLKIDTFQLGKGTQEITGELGKINYNSSGVNPTGAFYSVSSGINVSSGAEYRTAFINFQASRTWTGMSTSANPSTENLGTGTSLNIQPEFITLKFWKRLT